MPSAARGGRPPADADDLAAGSAHEPAERLAGGDRDHAAPRSSADLAAASVSAVAPL